jgi:nucleoside-triphosphatase
MEIAAAGGHNVLMIGPPGSGKTTLIRKISKLLEDLGCRIDGLIAPEVRQGGRRIGFNLCTLSLAKCWKLAYVDCISPVKVGKYGVCLEDVNHASAYLVETLEASDIIVIDEIGPMELAVSTLREAILKILESPKPVIGVVHRKLKTREPQIYRLIISRAPILWLTKDNRTSIEREALAIARVLASEVCSNKRG